jgi:hypothetical protein
MMPLTRMATPLISSSITPASRAPFRFRADGARLAAGSGLGAVTTAGTNSASAAGASANGTRAARRQANSCCGDNAYRRATALHGLADIVALRHDPRLLLRRPFPPPTGTREHLETARRLEIAAFKRKL